MRDACSCGARRVDRQIGLERSIAEYIDSLVGVFREVWRVLRPDGCVFINIGDSYSSQGGVGQPRAKNLCLIPERLALALQDAGWCIRSRIAWVKPAPMPESVQGSHCTKHRVTIAEYEAMFGVRATIRLREELAADCVLPVSEQGSEGEVSGQREGTCDNASLRAVAGSKGATAVVQRFTAGTEEQAQVRADLKRESHEKAPNSGVQAATSRPPKGKGPKTQTRPSTESDSSGNQRPLSEIGKGQGNGGAGTSEAARSNRSDSRAANPNGDSVARHPETGQIPLLLVQGKDQADAGPCDTAEQGRDAYGDECGASVLDLQFPQEQSDSDAFLVDCPGCDKCQDGWIAHLSAGRPTSAWEHVWLLTKNARYYYDAEAVREPLKRPGEFERKTPAVFGGAAKHNGYGTRKASGNPYVNDPGGRNLRNWWRINPDPSSETYCVACDLMYDRSPHGQVCVRCRGKLTAHYAAYPRALVERCIKAATPERGVCSLCLTPWVRVTSSEFQPTQSPKFPKGGNKGMDLSNGWGSTPRGNSIVRTLGWRPQCDCRNPKEPIYTASTCPALVLDPFSGTGTTLLVAESLGRRAVGTELSWEYCKYSQRRTAQRGLFARGRNDHAIL